MFGAASDAAAMLGFDGTDFVTVAARVRPIDLEPHRAALMKYARLWLRNAADVEDAVQDTLMAALAAPASFAGRSSPKTWLHGILKHKIVDIYRRQAREPLLEAPPEQEPFDDVDALFTPDGRWRETPAPWGDPESALGRREFYEVLEDCLACLPTNCARAFKMRELMGLEVSEICDVLDVSVSNCHVMLHRARMRLRSLLEQRWFAVPASASLKKTPGRPKFSCAPTGGRAGLARP
jgi:RNA polymerase sigma-70 factor (ECF subfamily)